MSEDQNIEFKESWRDKYLKWICGFANAQGGKIFIGKDDNGKVIGLKDGKKLTTLSISKATNPFQIFIPPGFLKFYVLIFRHLLL